MKKEKKLIRIKEYADLCGITTQSAYQRFRNGKLIGKMVYGMLVVQEPEEDEIKKA